MGFVAKFMVFAIVVGVAYVWHTITQIPPLPHMDRAWWGPGKPTKKVDSIKPFTINVSEEVLDDLAERLEFHGKLTSPLEGSNFNYGFNTDFLREVIEFWRNDYKWKEREAFLNSLPQFKTKVAGLDLHFIHVKPKEVSAKTRVLPLLLLHGWPGSFREFYDLIPLLTTPRKGVDFVFEVIAPSLPGFGFSEGAVRPGLGAAEMAVIMTTLMERVGHIKFYVQGEDWGTLIASNIATLYPDNVFGIHLSGCLANTMGANLKTFVGSFWPPLVVDDEHVHRMYPFWDHFSFLMQEFGYLHLHATKPDTIGIGLSDSPAGLAAYILEKFSTWTNPEWRSLPDGGLTKKFTLTDLIDNVMIYWVTGSITTSVRLYSETFTKAQVALNLDKIPTHVPTACVLFPHDLMYQSEFIVKEKYPNMVRFTHMPRGGHFAVFEEPKLVADDIWESVGIIDKRLHATDT